MTEFDLVPIARRQRCRQCRTRQGTVYGCAHWSPKDPERSGTSRAASATACTGGSYFMEIRGLEPLTYTLRTYRSPS